MLKLLSYKKELQKRAMEVAEGPKPGELLYVPTPFPRYNEVFGGIEIGVATLILGHTGDGKSSLLLELAVGGARASIPSLLLSTEDPKKKTLDRSLAQMTGISSLSLNRKVVTKAEARRLVSAADDMPDLLHFSVQPMSAAECIDGVRRWVARQREDGYAGPLLVIVDYLQALIETSSPETELADFEKEMNGLAGKEGIAIIVASQIRSEALNEAKRRFWAAKPPSTTPSQWKDMIGYLRPQLGDTEYSRRVEKSSKCIWVWFRPGRWARDLAGWDVADDVGEIHVLKANFGPTGPSEVRWDGATQRVYDT